MKRSIKLTSINGVSLKMHWTFLILLVWVIAANAADGLAFQLHLVNAGLFVINLIPAFPLDGGRILRVMNV